MQPWHWMTIWSQNAPKGPITVLQEVWFIVHLENTLSPIKKWEGNKYGQSSTFEKCSRLMTGLMAFRAKEKAAVEWFRNGFITIIYPFRISIYDIHRTKSVQRQRQDVNNGSFLIGNSCNRKGNLGRLSLTKADPQENKFITQSGNKMKLKRISER